MKKLITLITVIMIAFTLQTQAQDCDQGRKLAERTWEKWGPWKPNLNPLNFKKKVNDIKNVWNWIASNSSATIGPRLLDVDGGNETGTILGQTSSTFVTPPSFENKMEITINKFSGRAKTGVVICAMGQDGVLTQLREYEFPNDKNGKVKKFTVNNVKGKIVIVAMKNKSVGNKFQYRINAK